MPEARESHGCAVVETCQQILAAQTLSLPRALAKGAVAGDFGPGHGLVWQSRQIDLLEIADVVVEVAGDTLLDPAVCQHLQIEHADHASPRAKQDERADRTVNLRAVRSTTPDAG